MKDKRCTVNKCTILNYMKLSSKKPRANFGLTLEYNFILICAIEASISGMAMRSQYRPWNSKFLQALVLSPDARRVFNAGEVVNLVAIDAERFLESVFGLHILLSAPLQVKIECIEKTKFLVTIYIFLTKLLFSVMPGRLRTLFSCRSRFLGWYRHNWILCPHQYDRRSRPWYLYCKASVF